MNKHLNAGHADITSSMIPPMCDREHPEQTDKLLASSLRVMVAVRRVHGKLSEADGEGVAQILSLDADQLALLMQACARLDALADSFFVNNHLFHILVQSIVKALDPTVNSALLVWQVVPKVQDNTRENAAVTRRHALTALQPPRLAPIDHLLPKMQPHPLGLRDDRHQLLRALSVVDWAAGTLSNLEPEATSEASEWFADTVEWMLAFAVGAYRDSMASAKSDIKIDITATNSDPNPPGGSKEAALVCSTLRQVSCLYSRCGSVVARVVGRARRAVGRLSCLLLQHLRVSGSHGREGFEKAMACQPELTSRVHSCLGVSAEEDVHATEAVVRGAVTMLTSR